MSTDSNITIRRGRCVLWFKATGLLLGLGLLVAPAVAQNEEDPDEPKTPTFEEVMKRALREKRAASNAPIVAPAVPPAAPVVTRVPETKPPAPLPTQQPPVVRETIANPQPAATPPAVGTAIPTPAPVAPQPVVPPPVMRTEAPAPAVAPATAATTETSKPSKPQARSKGPEFSPLPPDLAPASPKPAVQSTSPASAAPTSADSVNAMAALDDKHLLAIGDRLSFRIVEDEEDPRPLTVMDSGELEVPHIGRFAAVGKSCRELAKALKAELEKEYYYQATVILAVDLMARSRGKVYLVGPVRMPGPQEIPSDESFTLSKAILRAGGFSDFADKKNVKITRKAADGAGENHITVDVSQILEKGQTSADVALLPGDLIYVPERLVRF